jgi:hypothetical protein
MKDKPVTCTSRVNMGQAYNLPDVRRGDYIEVANLLDAKVLQARGLVDIGRVPVDQLGRPYQQDDNKLERLQREVKERDRKRAAQAEARPEPQLLPHRDFDDESRRDIQLVERRRAMLAGQRAAEILRLGGHL